MGEELTISEIEQILESHKDDVVEGFYVTGNMLDDKIEKQSADFAYMNDMLESINTSNVELAGKYKVSPEQDGEHHQIEITGKSTGGTIVHNITINYFVMDTETEEAKKQELQELFDSGEPMVFESKRAKHGILDARIIDAHEFFGKAGALLGYAISIGDKDYARLMGVKFAMIAEKILGKRKE